MPVWEAAPSGQVSAKGGAERVKKSSLPGVETLPGRNDAVSQATGTRDVSAGGNARRVQPLPKTLPELPKGFRSFGNVFGSFQKASGASETSSGASGKTSGASGTVFGASGTVFGASGTVFGASGTTSEASGTVFGASEGLPEPPEHFPGRRNCFRSSGRRFGRTWRRKPRAFRA